MKRKSADQDEIDNVDQRDQQGGKRQAATQ
jgi:hypothetical protein